MLGTSLEHQLANVNTKFSGTANYRGIPKGMRQNFVDYNYFIKTDEKGNSTVAQEVQPLNEKKLDNLTVSRILKSLYKSNPDGLYFDKTILNDAEKIEQCGVTQYIHVNGEQFPVVFNTCGKRFCPHCTHKQAKSFSTEMAQIIDLSLCKKVDTYNGKEFKNISNEERKKASYKRIHGDYTTSVKPKYGFVTLTVPNCELEDLSRTITHMIKAWRDITRSREFRGNKGEKPAILGGMRALEVTFNADTMTFHPHFHILLVGNPRKNLKKWFTMSGLATKEENNYIAEKAWRDRWQKALHNVGHNVNISWKSINVQYISRKLDVTNESQRVAFCEEQARELGKYVWKYSDILSLAKPTYQNVKYDTGVNPDGMRFKEPRGAFGEEKTKQVQIEDWEKVKTAFWHTMKAVYRRQTHNYFGCLADARRQLREERAELANSGSMKQSNSKDCRTRIVEFTGEILIDSNGRQVWSENDAVQRLLIEKQEQPVYAIKYFKAKPNENGEREPFYQVISPEFDATRFENLQKNCPGRKEHILHNIQNMATFHHLTFENGKYLIHAKDNNNDILDIIRHISPRAWAQTEPGRYFYKVFLPSQRKQGKEFGSWRYLEDLHRKNISEQYAELSEYGDPEIPF